MNNIHQAVFVPIKRAVKTEVNKSIDKVTQSLDILKDKFGKTLNQNAEYYLNELKEQLQNQQASLEKIDAVIADFQKLNVLFK